VRRLGFVLVGLLLLASASATTYRALELSTMAQKAEIAFYGTVKSVSVKTVQGAPWTDVTFSVKEALKGKVGKEVTLAFYGGQTPDETLSVSNMPGFAAGDEVIVLAYDAPYYSPIVGFSQGYWKLSGRGFESQSGQLLGLDKDGKLTLSGSGAGTDALLAAFKKLLGEAESQQ
jgi:hypothetical protein